MPTCSGRSFGQHPFESQGKCASVPISCPTTYSYFYNDEQTYEAVCSGGSLGNSVSVTIAENTVASLVSKADANALALTQATDQATASLVCLWYNAEQLGMAECDAPQQGAISTYAVPAGDFSSTISQEDADEKALDYANKQAACARNCVWRNQSQTYTAKCEGEIIDGAVVPIGAPIGDPVTVTIPANTYESSVSQDDANLQAMNAAIAEAVSGLACVYVNTEQSVSDPCPGVIVGGSYVDPPGAGVGPGVTFTVPFNTYSSPVSQAAADALALADAQAQKDAPHADGRGCTWYNQELILTLTCAELGGCQFGDPVTVIVPFGTYTATNSVPDPQAEVDDLAYNYAYALALSQIECLCGNEEVTVTANCPDGFTGPSYTVTIPANTYFADNQADADNEAAEQALGIAEFNVGPCVATDTGGEGGEMSL